jgi:hypothetical protein
MNLSGPMIIPLQRPATPWRTTNRADINDIGVMRMNNNMTTFAGAGRITIRPGDCTTTGLTGDTDAAVVLLRAVNTIRILIINGQMIKLGSRLVVDGRPRSAAIIRNTGPTIIALDHSLRVGWINPEIMVIAMRGGHFFKIAPAVSRFPHFQVEDIDGIRINRVSNHVAEVPGSIA